MKNPFRQIQDKSIVAAVLRRLKEHLCYRRSNSTEKLSHSSLTLKREITSLVTKYNDL